MDSYLAIAEEVLRRARRPMSAMQILRIAYADGVAPAHLRGRSQQKTLQARLSEDILHRREASRFYRTAPGRFLLRDLLNDPLIPERDRQPITARRRKRDLPKNRPLAFGQCEVKLAAENTLVIQPSRLLALIQNGKFHYADSTRGLKEDEVVVWSFVIVIREGRILSYRQGNYREARDNFLLRRSIGFYTPVVDSDLGLFDQNDHGIVSSGVRAVASDLDLTSHDAWKALSENSELQSFVFPSFGSIDAGLLAIVSFTCPAWLEPTARRLAINDLEWLDLRAMPNHVEGFDPWSSAVLGEARRIALHGLT